jgi:methyl-accepting chemotaxis protein
MRPASSEASSFDSLEDFVMKNWKIRVKLLFGFLLVAILAAAVGGVGIYGVIKFNETQNRLFTHVKNMSVAGNLIDNLGSQCVSYRDAIINMDDHTRADDTFSRLKASMDEMSDDIAFLSENLMVEKNRAALKEISAANEDFMAQLENIESKIMANDEAAVMAVWPSAVSAEDVLLNEVHELVAMITDTADQESDYDTALARFMFVALSSVAAISVVIAVALGLTISRMIAIPVTRLVDAAGAIAIGDTDITIVADRKDEMGALAEAFGGMAAAIREQAGALARIADGDYRTLIAVRSGKDIMNNSINTVIEKNNRMLLDIKSASAQVSAGAGQIANAAQNLASGSSEQAATLEEFSATISEVLSQSEDNTEKSHEAYNDVQVAGEHMGKSMDSMANMTEAMREINESSNNIAKVIKVIDDIAFQTNILALNAAVEAARAGQHGKGFAVVADEVRNLASKSAEAAKETAALIEGSTCKVAEGGEITERTSESMKSVAIIAEKNAVSMQAISESSLKQSKAISEITKGMNQISDVVQATSATAEESAAAAEELSAQANMLEEIISRFKLRADDGSYYSQSGAGRLAVENSGAERSLPTLPAISLSSEMDKY